jgi:anti-sigma regulatory factor (Ser/Thr protein kinase)
MSRAMGRSIEGVRQRELVLPAVIVAPRGARVWLDDLLAGVVAGRLLDDIRLVVSELVSNSVRHSGSDVVVVRIRITPARIRVEVWDEGAGLVLRPQVTESRGLQLVRLLSARVSSGNRPGWSWVGAEFDLGR